MRSIPTLSILMALAFAEGCGGPDCAPPEHGSCTRDLEHRGARELSFVTWLVGKWRADDPDGRIHYERWSDPNGGIMHGYGRSFRDGQDLGTEVLRIERRNESITYTAHPEMRTHGTSFVLADLGLARSGELRFENPEHDFPTRIIYRRQNREEMHVRVENDEEGFSLVYMRVEEAE